MLGGTPTRSLGPPLAILLTPGQAATLRYDKHDIVYRAGLIHAAVRLWLMDPGDTS